MQERHLLVRNSREIELRAIAVVEVESDGLIALRLCNSHEVRSDEIGKWQTACLRDCNAFVHGAISYSTRHTEPCAHDHERELN